ncbi:hypothetical protein EV421DRAFT_1783902 [Armillaria borealis]|uniref:Uncharacterized protein n=1 Tax=Armillaria borealis TaxID=47425 RepID=A0AA39JTV5_9AGAR|nr:hypothetical protein EV421DRAFT_1783902 [Armillaria borealis]
MSCCDRCRFTTRNLGAYILLVFGSIIPVVGNVYVPWSPLHTPAQSFMRNRWSKVPVPMGMVCMAVLTNRMFIVAS